ncbi:hypothetical protein [Kribbella sp. CA-247076]|uniref:hypothetical protein n=1 Tax=Kribbella sp. CA-247076 TaxID=3239941 RepID=UPI003D8A2955
MPDEPGRHLSEALGGQSAEPLSHDERVEHERVRNLIQGVLSCYNTLVNQETDADRKNVLEAERALHTEAFRRRVAMSPAERAEVLHTYPDLLNRLQADLGR